MNDFMLSEDSKLAHKIPENVAISHEPVQQSKDTRIHWIRGKPKQDVPWVFTLWLPLKGEKGEHPS